jgi:hypothetical protein
MWDKFSERETFQHHPTSSYVPYNLKEPTLTIVIFFILCPNEKIETSFLNIFSRCTHL